MAEKRVAIVTGGARGIGAAITQALAKDGVHVAAGYSRNREAAEELAEKLKADGLSISVHQGNVGNPDDCQRVVEEVLGEHGQVDYLVNNAGVPPDTESTRSRTPGGGLPVDRGHAWPSRRPGTPRGRDRRRSGDLALFRRALCQLSYPTVAVLTGFEPAASGLTGRRALQAAPQDLDGHTSLPHPPSVAERIGAGAAPPTGFEPVPPP